MLSIRAISQPELPDLLALYQHLHSTDESPSLALAATVWREICANSRIRYFGGYADGQLVSACALTVIPNLTRGGRPFGLIENVVTHADYRRKGYGRAILQKALAHSWSQACYKVVLSTGRRDEATHQFYSAAGFDRNEKQAYVARPEA